MKFAKSMEELMVPEWSSKYIQYKEGKKKIKLLTNTFRTPSTTPPAINAKDKIHRTKTRAHAALSRNGLNPHWHNSSGSKRSYSENPTWSLPGPEPTTLSRDIPNSQAPGAGNRFSFSTSPTSVEFPREVHWRGGSSRRGSANIEGSLQEAAAADTLSADDRQAPPSLKLPEPIQPLEPLVELLVENNTPPRSPRPDIPMLRANTAEIDISPLPLPDSMISPQTTQRPLLGDEQNIPKKGILARSITFSPRPFVKRVSTFFGPNFIENSFVDVTKAQIVAAAEFHGWLIEELRKIEEFYKQREEEAVQRFDEMKEQLDVLRDRWFRNHYRIAYEGDAGDVHDTHISKPTNKRGSQGTASGNESGAEGAHRRSGWRDTIVSIGRGGNDDSDIASLSSENRDSDDARKDYERRNPTNDPGHKLAKSKLKYAYIEYYHRLELLKAYVQLNRDAFRKITKKFDKISGLRTSGKFMGEHINKSYFGGTENKLEDLINDTEILFARFFSRSNRKEAALRLRTKENKSVYHSSLLRSGFFLGSSMVIGLSSVWEALRILNDPDEDPEMKVRTSYILQIWGGVFLILLQTLLFAINLRIWARNRINYAFIFEFDNRHHLNHRQFLEIPSLFGLIFTICFWFSIQNFWEGELDMIHFPIIYVAIAGAILFNPIKAFYFRARVYFITTMVRLMFSGFYHVEFKDFWMGDMLCSQTYALGNIYLYFCLYAQAWDKPERCNSSHSYTMGVFMCVPAIWRLIQCFRRYYDSRQAFPHLANGAKYGLTILQYLTLTLWRNDKPNNVLKGAFITMATISSIVSIFWDVVMDWSLLNPYAQWPFLRDRVGFKKAWPYYFAMFIDPPLRFSWVFYIIYASEIQHSALLSFIISTGEVLRRFIWCFFRMENEHCGNVGANRAYRDPRLPYHFKTTDSTVLVASPVPENPETHSEPLLVTPAHPTVDIEQGHVTGMRHRQSKNRSKRHGAGSPAMQALERLGRTMTNAHKKDYERKRNPEDDVASSSDDEEEDEGGAESADFYQRTAEGEAGDLTLTKTVTEAGR